MPLPGPADPASLPLHVLFPEEYARSARMVAKDFAFFGGAIVLSIVGAAALFQLA